MTDLQTVDLPGVEILSAGGPVFGTGSAPGGDHYTRADLEALAAAGRELADEIRAGVKLGHNAKQQLLKDSGFVLDDGTPAAGWLENLRVEGDRLLADLRRVPRVVDQLIRAGAYRHRSVEMRPVTSQRTGKRYAWAVTGLALLGAKQPAVRTLNDIVKLYEAEGIGARDLGSRPPVASRVRSAHEPPRPDHDDRRRGRRLPGGGADADLRDPGPTGLAAPDAALVRRPRRTDLGVDVR